MPTLNGRRTRSLPELVDVQGSRVLRKLLSTGSFAALKDGDGAQASSSTSSGAVSDSSTDDSLFEEIYSRWPHANRIDAIESPPCREATREPPKHAPRRDASTKHAPAEDAETRIPSRSTRSSSPPTPTPSCPLPPSLATLNPHSRLGGDDDSEDDGWWHFPEDCASSSSCSFTRIGGNVPASHALEDEWHLYDLKRMDPLSFSLWFIACYSDWFYAVIPDYLLRVVPHSGTLLSMLALYFFTQAQALLWAFLSIAVSIMCTRAVQFIDKCNLLSAVSMHWLPDSVIGADNSATAADFAGGPCRAKFTRAANGAGGQQNGG